MLICQKKNREKLIYHNSRQIETKQGTKEKNINITKKIFSFLLQRTMYTQGQHNLLKSEHTLENK